MSAAAALALALAAAPAAVNPRPWETAVRLRVGSGRTATLGSGTVVASDARRSVVLTCGHLLRGRPPVAVDLFDGRLGGPARQEVRAVEERYAAEVLDADPARDVGLVAFRPGRALPFSRVVPPHWSPRRRFGMIAVGCPEGRDATAWNTVIVNPSFRGLAGRPSYEAIACVTAPLPGRSGGGLFTTDGYLAGVCNFAAPDRDEGLYAAPGAIYQLLGRNGLAGVYEPLGEPVKPLPAAAALAAALAAAPIASGQAPLASPQVAVPTKMPPMPQKTLPAPVAPSPQSGQFAAPPPPTVVYSTPAPPPVTYTVQTPQFYQEQPYATAPVVSGGCYGGSYGAGVYASGGYPVIDQAVTFREFSAPAVTFGAYGANTGVCGPFGCTPRYGPSRRGFPGAYGLMGLRDRVLYGPALD